MKHAFGLVLAIAAICVLFSGCGEKNEGFALHETPQVYVLKGEENPLLASTMPTVTLYENGNARLSQPMVSSYAMFGIGKHKVVKRRMK